ncbi:hypothetical protein Awo_c12440 [Acetobacterium woodii DSM 1030]|uniref:Uncharacterized protein n=1 Tax=Acetobacterium woodii (strain ATCC 29683 / DSM 1030 / JCM 2381 / KCTC 1655 / WB1) TaxID=931626 RepID=H6LDY5_ACEWD|nr:hypothetical protein Awo_c12440 [Acetobacterium woodii DSM 1030]
MLHNSSDDSCKPRRVLIMHPFFDNNSCTFNASLSRLPTWIPIICLIKKPPFKAYLLGNCEIKKHQTTVALGAVSTNDFVTCRRTVHRTVRRTV